MVRGVGIVGVGRFLMIGIVRRLVEEYGSYICSRVEMSMRRGLRKEIRLLLVCLKAQELPNLHSPLTCQGQF